MSTSKASTSAPSTGKKDAVTEAEAKSVDGTAGQKQSTSHDQKSHTKAGTDTGAGGGKKQERKH